MDWISLFFQEEDKKKFIRTITIDLSIAVTRLPRMISFLSDRIFFYRAVESNESKDIFDR